MRSYTARDVRSYADRWKSTGIYWKPVVRHEAL